MKRFAFALALSAALTMPAFAAPIFIPIGPPTYTPQPDIVTPQPDLVTPQPDLVTPQPDLVNVTPGAIVSEGPGSDAPKGSLSETCLTADIFGNPFVNGPQCFVPLTLSPNTGGYQLPATTTITAQPDLITPQPDLVTPQPDIVTPQPDLCSQPGISIPGGWGSRPC